MVWGERLYPTDFFIFQLDSCILSLQSETPAGLRFSILREQFLY